MWTVFRDYNYGRRQILLCSRAPTQQYFLGGGGGADKTDKAYSEEGLSDWRILLLYTSFISISSDIHHLNNIASLQEVLTLPYFQPFAYISKVSFSSCLKNDDSFTVYLMKNLPLIFAQRPLTFLREERLISSLFQLTPELRGGTLCL